MVPSAGTSDDGGAADGAGGGGGGLLRSVAGVVGAAERGGRGVPAGSSGAELGDGTHLVRASVLGQARPCEVCGMQAYETHQTRTRRDIR